MFLQFNQKEDWLQGLLTFRDEWTNVHTARTRQELASLIQLDLEIQITLDYPLNSIFGSYK